MKAFCKVREPVPTSKRTLATYLLTRSAAGEWSQQQVLGEMLYPVAVFDRQQQGRLFTGDDQTIYIYREEDGFEPRAWMEVPYPAGTTATSWKSMVSSDFATWFKVQYARNNKLVGTLSMPVAPIWAYAVPDLSDNGACYFNALLFEDENGLGVSRPLSVGLRTNKALTAGLIGIKTAIDRPTHLALRPTGSGFMVAGESVAYSYEGGNVGTNIGQTYYVGEAP
jgi:hypothetical protein